MDACTYFYGVKSSEQIRLHPSFITICATLLLIAFCSLSCNSARANLRLEPSPAKLMLGRLYLVGIGIDKYANEKFTLQACRADVESIHQALGKNEQIRALFSDVVDSRLYDESATRENILKSLDNLSSACRPEDTVIFDFSGIGTSSGKGSNSEDFNLVPYDGTAATSTLISGKQLGTSLTKISALNQVVILDSSGSGDAFDWIAANIMGRNPDITQLSGKNIVLLGIPPSRQSLEENGHGLFSKCILDALTPAADLDHNNIVSIREVELYLDSHFFRSSKFDDDGKSGAFPRIYDIGQDFPVIAFKGQNYVRYNAPLMPFNEALHPFTGIPRPLMRDLKFDQSNKAIEEVPHFKNQALFVATNDYKHYPKLYTPIADARALAKLLREDYDWNTTVLENPTCGQFLKAWSDLRSQKFDEQDEVMVYVAGHGMFDESVGVGRLVFADAEPGDISKCLSYWDLKGMLEQTKCNHVLLVLDVCHGGTFLENVRASAAQTRAADDEPKLQTSKVFERKMKWKSRKVLASSETESVSDGVEHSPFAAGLLTILGKRNLNSGYISFSNVTSGVAKIPPGPVSGDFSSDFSNGDFYFVQTNAKH